MDDLFLKIIRGDIPSAKVYEDEHVYAFLDINPHNKGHALVAPKVKYRNILDIDEETLCAMMRAVRKIARAVKAATGAEGINIGMNNEPAAGQEIFHAHIHIVPRFLNDGVYKPARHARYEKDEMDAVAAKIRASLED